MGELHYKAIGIKIRRLMAQKNLNPGQVAAKQLGLSEASVIWAADGKQTPLEILERIALALDVPPTEFIVDAGYEMAQQGLDSRGSTQAVFTELFTESEGKEIDCPTHGLQHGFSSTRCPICGRHVDDT